MLTVQLLTCVVCLNDVSRHCDFDCDKVTSTWWQDIRGKSWPPSSAIILQPPEKQLPQSLVLKGAYMHNHLADDDTPAFFGQCDDTRTRPPITVKTHTEVGFRIWRIEKMPVMEITSKICLDCCRIKQQDIYSPFLHIQRIAVDLFSCTMFDCFQA